MARRSRQRQTALAGLKTGEQACVCFAAIRGFALYSSRLPLIRSFLARGWTVVIATQDDEFSRKLVEEGARLEAVDFRRGGVGPLSDLSSLLRLRQIYARYRPRLIHQFHAKPVILGTLAARVALGASVRVVNTITGLGHAFTAGGLTQTVAGLGYRWALKFAAMTIFQNHDDRRLFLDNRWVEESRTRLVISSGVDCSRFRPDPRIAGRNPVVLLIARLLARKGIPDFIQLAKRLKPRYPAFRFQIAGEPDESHPNAVPLATVREAAAQGAIEYLGYVGNLPEVMPAVYLLLYPSVYREGVPRVVLEASASGVPTVAYDAPGTREAVQDGLTGRLVPPGDIAALERATVELMENQAVRNAMGLAARRMAEESFSVEHIVRQQLDVYAAVGIGATMQAEGPGR